MVILLSYKEDKFCNIYEILWKNGNLQRQATKGVLVTKESNDKITELIIIIGNKWTDCSPRFLVSLKLCFTLNKQLIKLSSENPTS